MLCSVALFILSPPMQYSYSTLSRSCASFPEGDSVFSYSEVTLVSYHYSSFQVMGIEFLHLVFPARVPLFLHVGACMFQHRVSPGCMPFLFISDTVLLPQRRSNLTGDWICLSNYIWTSLFFPLSLKVILKPPCIYLHFSHLADTFIQGD